MTFVLGLLLSYFLNTLYKRQKTELDPNLYFPVIGNRIRRRQMILGIDDGGQEKYTFTVVSCNDTDKNGEVNNTRV